MQKQTKIAPVRRGRPRAYDPDIALEHALNVFWDNGYSGTTLDMLVAATRMNRPSLAAAFGDKQSIYIKSFERFAARMSENLRQRLDQEESIDAALTQFFAAAIDVYLSGNEGQRGCFVIATATTESITDPQIKNALLGVLKQIDSALEARLLRSVAAGQISRTVDAAGLAHLASATLHSLAVRARAGQRRASLELLARTTVNAIVGETRNKKNKTVPHR